MMMPFYFCQNHKRKMSDKNIRIDCHIFNCLI